MNPERLPYETRTQSANRRLNGSYGKNYEEIIFKIKHEIEAELPTSVKETLNTYVMSFSSGPKVESVQHFLCKLGMEPHIMHLVVIIIFSLHYVIIHLVMVRLTKIINRAWLIFRR